MNCKHWVCRSLLVVVPAVITSVSLPMVVHADEATSDVLQEIVVTAQKRSENLQKVPLTINVVNSEQLASLGATSAVDLNAIVPGMQVVAQGPYAMISIRGIGTQQANQFGDPVIGYNVDGVIHDRSINASTGFFDVRRVEVLKGPQGTLYGRNATAGAINIITNKPTNQFGVNAQVDIGNYKTVNTSGMINMPLSDTLAVRFAFQSLNHAGYFSDGFNDADEVDARAHLLYKPTSTVSILFSADYAHQGGLGSEDVPLPIVKDPWDSRFYANYSVGASTVGTPYVPQSYYNIAPFQDNTFYGVSAQLDADLGFATLTVIPAYRYTRQNMLYHNFDAYSRIDNPTHQTTLEARLGHTGDGSAGSITWVGGLYFFRLEQTAIAAYEFNCFCANDASPNYITSPNNVGRELNDLNSRSYAAFAQGTYFFTERFRGTLGGRFTHDQKSENGTQATNLYTIGVVIAPPDVGSATWSNFSWKAGLEADLTPNSLLYTSVATGYKAGGLNEGFNAQPYDQEKLTAFSVGSKNRLWNNRLIVNGEVFFWDYKNHQVATTSGLPGGGVGYVGVNIPKSTEYGLDLDLQALVTQHDRLSVSAEYLVGKTGGYTLPTSSIGVVYTTTGTSMISAPRFNYTVELAHDWDLPNGGSVIAAGLFHYTTTQLLYGIAVPDAYAPAAGIGDLNLTYKAPKDTWFIRAYVNNVAKKAAVLSVFPGYETRDFIGPNPGSDFVQYGNVNAPRTFGVRVGTQF